MASNTTATRPEQMFNLSRSSVGQIREKIVGASEGCLQGNNSGGEVAKAVPVAGKLALNKSNVCPDSHDLVSEGSNVGSVDLLDGMELYSEGNFLELRALADEYLEYSRYKGLMQCERIKLSIGSYEISHGFEPSFPGKFLVKIAKIPG